MGGWYEWMNGLMGGLMGGLDGMGGIDRLERWMVR